MWTTAILAVLVPAGAALAEPVTSPPIPMALGFMAGEPSGVTMRMINPDHPAQAVELGLGWSVAGENGLQAEGQYQWHLVEMKSTPEGLLTFYLGAGGRVKNVDGTRFGLRGSTGINYVRPRSPRRWEAFFELAPILDLTPDNDTWLDAQVGVRWFLPQGRR